MRATIKSLLLIVLFIIMSSFGGMQPKSTFYFPNGPSGYEWQLSGKGYCGVDEAYCIVYRSKGVNSYGNYTYTVNMSSNSFFIGKGILNKNYYNKKEKIYKNKLIYTTTELFSMINLNSNDVTGRNTSHKRKSLNQALSRLDDEGIIKIDRVNSERLILSKVWNVEDLC